MISSNHIPIYVGATYLLFWVTLSNYIVLNLFLAVLLDSMRDIEDEDNKEIIQDIENVKKYLWPQGRRNKLKYLLRKRVRRIANIKPKIHEPNPVLNNKHPTQPTIHLKRSLQAIHNCPPKTINANEPKFTLLPRHNAKPGLPPKPKTTNPNQKLKPLLKFLPITSLQLNLPLKLQPPTINSLALKFPKKIHLFPPTNSTRGKNRRFRHRFQPPGTHNFRNVQRQRMRLLKLHLHKTQPPQKISLPAHNEWKIQIRLARPDRDPRFK